MKFTTDALTNWPDQIEHDRMLTSHEKTVNFRYHANALILTLWYSLLWKSWLIFVRRAKLGKPEEGVRSRYPQDTPSRAL